MLAYIVRRVFLSLFTIWVISMLAFVIIELPPGDQVDRFKEITESRRQIPDPDKIDQLREYLGLDQPQYIRYLKWMANMAQGDLGLSFQYRQEVDEPVKKLLEDRLWLTVVLTGFTVIVTWTFALPVGIYSAIRQHSVGDYVFTFLGFSGLAVPDFLLGLVLMYVAFAYFDQSVGGLNSADYANTPWNFARFMDLVDPPVGARHRAGHFRHGRADPRDAQQPARRARIVDASDDTDYRLVFAAGRAGTPGCG